LKHLKARRLSAFVDGLLLSLLMMALENAGIEGEVAVQRGEFVLVYSCRLAKSVLMGLEEEQEGKITSVIEDEKEGGG
jgi:hypothetical protein